MRSLIVPATLSHILPLVIADEPSLTRYGWNPFHRASLDTYVGEGALLGRISAEHKGGYVVYGEVGERRASLSGKLRRAVATGSLLRPTVGDWVVMTTRADGAESAVVIHGVLPRRTTIARKMVGSESQRQVIASNVDVVFVATAVGAELNLRRIERYLSLVRDSGAEPVVVLTKADANDDALATTIEALHAVARGVAVHATSARMGTGIAPLGAYFEGNQTVAVIGSSGVGKSTLVNAWLGGSRQVVTEIRGDGKGRHTTTHRALFVVPGGGLVVDTPGMREVGLWDAEDGIREAFDDIEALATDCRFRNCSHAAEPGCALHRAVASGVIAKSRLESFIRLGAETAATASIRPEPGASPGQKSRRNS